MPTLLAVPLAIAIIGLGPLQAHEAANRGEPEELDTEHIFGFTEGAYIGEKGEKEIENTAVERFGKSRRYSFFENETAFRAVIPDNIRFSFGTLLDGYAIKDGPGLPATHRVRLRWGDRGGPLATSGAEQKPPA